jgi:hypothetical protein
MALPILANVFQAVLNWSTVGGQEAKNVLYFETTAAGDEASLAAAIDASTHANQFDAVSDEAAAHSVSIRPLDGITAPTPFPLAHWAGSGAHPFAPGVSTVISLYTDHAGKSGRGRMYLPFTPDNASNDGLLADATVVNLTTAWNAFQAAMLAAHWAWDVVSTITHHTHTVHNVDHSVTRGIPLGPAVPAQHVISRVVPQKVLGTQRRRQSRLRG